MRHGFHLFLLQERTLARRGHGEWVVREGDGAEEVTDINKLITDME